MSLDWKRHLLARVQLRDLLVADLLVDRGVAPAEFVGEVVAGFLARAERKPGDLLAALAAGADLRPDRFVQVELEADRLIAKASGSPFTALSARGGIDEGIHRKAAEQVAGASQFMTEEGVPPRAEPCMPQLGRFLDFILIAQGGMGYVYLVTDTQLQRVVAMKVMKAPAGIALKGDLRDPLTLQVEPASAGEAATLALATSRFLREVYVTGLLEHPGVVPIHEVGRTPGGLPYFTMRYVRGSNTLYDELLQAPHLGSHERLRLLEPFLRVCDTIAYAHDRGVLHRDLTPSNVALGDYGEVFVLDWGLATRRPPPDGTEDVASTPGEPPPLTYAGAGTPGYSAPEAVFGGGIDARSDVFSLSAILYEILTGVRAFPAWSLGEYGHALKQGRLPPAPHDVDRSVPADLSEICMRGLSLAPAERPTCARELADAVRVWQGGQLVDGEVSGYLRRAETALGEATTLEGDALLRRLAVAETALEEIERRRPSHPRLAELRGRVQALREGERTRRERAARRLALRWAVLAGVLAVAFLGSLLVRLLG